MAVAVELGVESEIVPSLQLDMDFVLVVESCSADHMLAVVPGKVPHQTELGSVVVQVELPSAVGFAQSSQRNLSNQEPGLWLGLEVLKLQVGTGCPELTC